MKKAIFSLAIFGLSLTFLMPVSASNIQYTYDSLNRVIKVDYGDGRVIQYSYDQDGNRITQTVNAAGSITVTISPQGAVDAGAQWSVDGGTLETSGATVSDLSVGQHTVSFSDISGWTTPSSQNISVTDGETASVTGTYAQALNGACGSSNGGTFTSAPTGNLCSSGTPTTVTGSGPWYWSCQGINGGTNASCLAGFWQNATPTGDGWEYLSPFGFFFPTSSLWIYHQTLGWLYPVGTTTDSIWFYDPQWDGQGGWWWTSSSLFPWLYSVTENEWLYYDAKDSTLSTRWFFTTAGQASTH